MQVLAFAFFVVLPLVQAGVRPTRGATHRQSNAVAFITHVYAEYAWETKETESRAKTSLFFAPPAVLHRFFDAPLAKAILADRACEARTQGECHLSFDPMWDSQDPGGVAVQVVPTRDSMVVQARLHYPYQNETRVVTYRLRNTPAGLRIVDMSGRQWTSLLNLLQQPVR
jgi:hypothetical protein